MDKPLENETLVYFGPEPWHGLWRNRHQLMSRFATTNTVWYVEPPVLLRQLLKGRKVRTKLFSRNQSGVNVFHSPWWLPIVGRAPFKGVTIGLYKFILFLVTGSRSKRSIVWYSKPEMVDFALAIPAKTTIYHIVDEYSGYGSPNEAQRAKIEAKEIELLGIADLAIVVTPTLLERKSPYNAKTHLVPNAVDFAAYADDQLTVPDQMRDLRGPVIGYTGLIAARLDLSLLRESAVARPDWNFVFVGAVNHADCSEAMQQLGELSNVHFLGEKSVAETPRYVRQFSVCMIPYTVNLRAAHASPLKLYEYAAASKPIVTTDFSAARTFEGYVEIATDMNTFLDACERCLDSTAISDGLAKNLAFAKNNTWDHRVDQLSGIIRAHTQS